jgi:hypothetical protein
MGSPPLPFSPSPHLAWCFIAASLLLTGCPREKSKTATPPPPRASVALRVLVVNEPELVEAVNRLRGEWAERSGGELNATGTTWKELSTAKEINADVVIFPSRYLGEFCVRNWLRPVRASVLDSDELDAADYFPVVRNELIKWGGQTMALPLGIEKSVQGGPRFPPSLELITWAAPNAISDDRIGVLFDAETMKPRITESAFVDALQRQVESLRISIKRPTPDGSIPVLGYNDRLAAVTSSSNNAASAFRLLEWIARPNISSQLVGVGSRQITSRRSFAPDATNWRGWGPREREEFGKHLKAKLGGQKSLVIPRIPGIDEYLAAADESINAAIKNEGSPIVVLRKVADRWEQITEARGREKQREAYQKHLGIK